MNERSAANRQELVEKIRSVFWQPLRIADHDAASAALDALAADTDELEAALAAMSKTVEQMTVHRDRSYRQGYDRGFRQAMSAARDGIDREMRLHESMEMKRDG